MKLQLQCDKCGRVGPPPEIDTDYDGLDLCEPCRDAETIDVLRQRLQQKREWLEATHLKEIREMEEKIKALKVKMDGDGEVA